jgi:C-terminal processing protease CtpA/Prc
MTRIRHSIPRSLDPSIPSPQVGDELVEFDGKTVAELIAEHRLQFSYSTEGAFYRHMVEMLGFGSAGAEVKLVLRRKGMKGQRDKGIEGEGSQDMPVTVKRTVTREAWVTHLARKRQSPGYRMLEGNIGYMDLGRIASLQEFERAFEALRHADGLVVDIRGYPGFMVQLALSARLSDQPVKSAIFEIPVVSGYARLEQGWNSGQYEVQPDPNKRYSGPVAVLINEKTFGGSEDVCVYLKNAGRVTFVGGTTAGCNGNRTWLSLPGGGRLWFTGMRVKFGDGSRFQNIGIVPDVPAAPTVDGVKAGRDEVMEKGLEVLRRLVHSPSSPEPPQTKDQGQSDKGRQV